MLGVEIINDDGYWLHRWRSLDDNDIKAVLESLSPRWRTIVAPDALRYAINDSIEEVALDFHGWGVGAAPHVRRKELYRLRGALLRVFKCLGDHGVMSFQLQSALGKHRTSIPVAPSALETLPLVGIGEAIDALRLLWLAAAECDAREEQRQEELGTKNAPRRVDDLRYMFVEELAGVFETMFKTKVSQKAEGPWCSFLAVVLSRCEGKKLTKAGASSLWKQIRRATSLGQPASLPTPVQQKNTEWIGPTPLQEKDTAWIGGISAPEVLLLAWCKWLAEKDASVADADRTLRRQVKS